MKRLILLLFLALINNTFSQNLIDSIGTDSLIDSVYLENSKDEIVNIYNPLMPPNTYSNNDNPNYWKNKMPYAGYWQQDVHYKINAELIDQKNLIQGTEELHYTNNSPDDLNYLFFHLYINAFEPDSYLDKFRTSNKMKSIYREDEKKKQGIEILSVKSNDEILDIEIDNTIMKVYLKEPVKSGETVIVNIDFESHFGGNEETGNVRRRMKMYEEFGNKHYNGVHWYPRVSVYDRKFGWTTDQHLGKEFYGDFGCFDVELTLPSNYILEATGFMINREEMLPKELMKKLDIKNFANKKYNSPPSTIIKYNPNKKKTWKFHAENVHDFSFTADPSYRIGISEWNGIKCYSLAQEQHASKWQNAADYAAQIIQVFSEDFGMYTYHKIIVADARSGMEYPMITLDRGKDPGYRGLLIHEIGHMWFFGQVGNNETYRAALDEGFTQFMTAWGTEVIEGKYMTRDLTFVDDTLLENKSMSLIQRLNWLKRNKSPLNKYFDKHTNQLDARDDDAFYRYIMDATDNNTPQLNTHSHDFGGSLAHRGSYTHVYGKTATMLFNLQYVLGDELFLAAIQNYFNTWKMAHPYLNDFRNSIINFTKVDLNWFFDQWLDTNKDLDYSVKRVKKLKNDTVEITISRNGEMEMPIDLTIDSKFGLTYDYHIPNTWFTKADTERDYLLPRWIGYGNLQEEYTFKQQVPSGVKNVIIDKSNRLADSYMINNRYRGNTEFYLDWGVRRYSNLRKYEIKARPDLWYNAYDGIKIGPSIKGDYLKKHHVFEANFWINTGFSRKDGVDHRSNNLIVNDDIIQNNGINNLMTDDEINQNDPFSFRFIYSTSLNKYIKNSRIRFAISSLDGLQYASLGYEVKDISGMNTLDISLNSYNRKDDTDLNYLFGNLEWGTEKGAENMRNTNIKINSSHEYNYLFPWKDDHINGHGDITLSLKSSSFMSDYNFSKISLELINRTNVHDFKIHTRVFAQAGFKHGDEHNFPYESMLYASGANPEEMMHNKYTRTAGFVPHDWFSYSLTNTNHFHYGGGLNLRGYSGYYMPERTNEMITDSLVNLAYKGLSGAAFNMEIDFTDAMPYLSNFGIDSYVFMDAGFMDNNYSDDKFLSSHLYMDAGVGFTLEISRLWNRAIDAKPLTLRLDFPVFLNRPPNEKYTSLNRFVFGINRAF